MERFWSKVDKSSDCWVWTASTIKDGYGQFRGPEGMVLAHRFSYTLQNGVIPDGFCVCHTCDNPPCVNPSHLFVGTQKTNTQDMMGKGRNNPRTKLSDETCLSIFVDTRYYREIAEEHGIHLNTVYNIKNGKVRKHLYERFTEALSVGSGG